MDVPTDVSEITLGQFLDLRKMQEPVGAFEVIELLAGRDIPELHTMKYTPKMAKQLEDIMKLTNILNASIQEFNASPSKVDIPKSVNILGIEVKASKDLDDIPFWPTRVAKDLIESKKKENGEYDPIDDFDKIIAHYLYTAYTGTKYNERRAEEFVSVVRSELKFDEAVQLGNFFLAKLSKYLLPKRKYWRLRLQMKKYRLVSKIFKFLGR